MKVQLLLLVRGGTVRETEWTQQTGEALQAREEGEGQVAYYKNIFKSKKGSK